MQNVTVNLLSLTRFIAQKVFIHREVDLNRTMLHYFSSKLVWIGVNEVRRNSYISNSRLWLPDRQQ